VQARARWSAATARVGGDSEGRKKSPEDVKAFLKKVFALTP
jgi:hypothetical protein